MWVRTMLLQVMWVMLPCAELYTALSDDADADVCDAGSAGGICRCTMPCVDRNAMQCYADVMLHDAMSGELMDSIPNSLGYRPKELTDSSTDSLGYRPEKKTSGIMTDAVRVVGVTSPRRRKTRYLRIAKMMLKLSIPSIEKTARQYDRCQPSS